MTRLISFVHGVASGPNQNWFIDVAKKANTFGYGSLLPQYPSRETRTFPYYPDTENFSEWDAVFEQTSGPFLDRIDALVGHSLGGTFLLRKLEQDNRRRYKLVCTASSTIGSRPIQHYYGNIDSFTHNGEFDWEAIRSSADHFIHFHGDNDSYINRKEAEILAEHTHGKLIMIERGRHLSGHDGYVTFNRLVEEMRSVLQPT